MKPLFAVGRLMWSPGAIRAFTGIFPMACAAPFLRRHFIGDWGDLDARDWLINDIAVTTGGEIVSAYHLSSGTRFYIITDGDRSTTTILLPEEY